MVTKCELKFENDLLTMNFNFAKGGGRAHDMGMTTPTLRRLPSILGV